MKKGKESGIREWKEVVKWNEMNYFLSKVFPCSYVDFSIVNYLCCGDDDDEVVWFSLFLMIIWYTLTIRDVIVSFRCFPFNQYFSWSISSTFDWQWISQNNSQVIYVYSFSTNSILGSFMYIKLFDEWEQKKG